MISYGKQSIDQSDIDAVVDILKGDRLTQGPAVETFANDLKLYFGARHACVVANGTAALHLTGMALGWQPGDIVITSPITFLATANCIIYAEATPDFVDIDPNTYTLDPKLVEKKVKAYQSKGNKVKAIIGVDSGIIDLILIGKINQEILQQLIVKTEKLINRKIRPMILTKQEFKKLDKTLDIEHAFPIWGG